jgi:ABC-type dipeptide/oligopeptide/nickel transport system permease component
MKIKIFMSKFRNFIKNLDKKTLIILHVLAFISWMIAVSTRNHHFENGYRFIIPFLLILPVYILGIVIMLRLVYQLEGPPRHPFHLLKYSFYFIILSLTSFLIFYLWGMRDVISHLNW